MRRRRSLGSLSVVLVLLSCIFANCGQRKQEPPEVEPQDPLWSQFISAHTSGLVSKKAKIRVLFSSDVINPGRVGEAPGSVLRVDPHLAGNLTFSSPREIVLVPEQDLESGRHYRVTIEARGLDGIPAGLDRYEFVFQVIEQQFEVNIEGLSSSSTTEGEMILKGFLLTADVEDADPIEKILSAIYLDATLPVEWQHNADGKHHQFSVPGIARQAAAQRLTLSWDGGFIGVDTSGGREIDVPSRDQFEVTRVQAVRGEQQFIQVYFSDNLDPRQNLTGLVRLDQGSFTTRVEGNLLKIYPDPSTVGTLVVSLEPGIRNVKGDRLEPGAQHSVTIVTEKPQVRFAGQGVILPENPVLSIPFEAVGVQSVRVTAFRIYQDNVAQFLQANKLDGSNELGRVGRYLWRRTIHLSSPEPNKWNRYSLDATELFENNPGGLFRLTLSVRLADSTYTCHGVPPENADSETPIGSDEDLNVNEISNWNYWEDYYGTASDGSNWNDRDDPCKLAYFKYASGTTDSRNFLASNIGLLAKQDQRGKLLLAATDLRTSKPMSNVTLSVMNFQNQRIGKAVTDVEGLAELDVEMPPFYLLAEKAGEKGYLKLSKGTALPISHFDVGGEKVNDGIKGVVYGERSVWRPGDDMYLTFVLEDKEDSIPDEHPVTMELYNPKGQILSSQTVSTPLDGFYPFVVKTASDAPTGVWTAKAVLGGNSYTKNVRVETVMPNRLKVDLDFGQDTLSRSRMPLEGELFGQWLSGATASNLNADVQVRLSSTATRFTRNTDFVFDDPAREFRGEPETLFEGKLDNQGHARFRGELSVEQAAPGKLTASFTSRVFERGGAFSVSRKALAFSPYERYIGVKLPKGDQTRNMLLTDTDHIVELASLDSDGEPVSVENIEVTLRKIEWKWWWDSSGDSLANYASASAADVVLKDNLSTREGRGTWTFQIKYPSWGRYLLRACDTQGGHCSGKVFYIDWPGWAGRAQEQGGPGANVLTFVADKPKYNVGDVAKLHLPEATEGRALVTIENGTGILERQWIELAPNNPPLEVPITKAMSPNVYVSVSLIQPHAGKKNDRPIRLYGIIPLEVDDPETRLEPAIAAPEEWAPESTATVRVSEANGRPMTYTVAVVDEGLLGLTNFKTPNLRDHFYKREALGVSTWDLFDEVVGAYGGELERLLALGGGLEDIRPEAQERKRFPPVVTYLGPFRLEPGKTNQHSFELPQYVGAVRVMVVAGRNGAYGSAEKSVFVRQPLMLLATLPRVVGPGEELAVPVSLFVMDPAIRDVRLTVEPDRHFDVVGNDTVTVHFDEPDEKIGVVQLKVRPRLGMARLRFSATGAEHRARAEVNIDIRNPNPPTVDTTNKVLGSGETWETQVVPHGLEDTNSVTLEVSAVPPLDLERRLDYLIRYPHGCLEQVTSSVFPQLYLSNLVNLEPTRREEIERNLIAGIDRLRGFQVPSGAFVYWPGGFWVSSGFDARNAWSTNYVGHFLLEAKKLGYHVPAEMLSDWVKYQKSAAQSWSAGSETSVLDQAYRLYTLALANQPELGAMNRLRETQNLPSVARWQLAAAYHLAGLTDAAGDLARGNLIEIRDYAEPDVTFGSSLRDRAIVLNAMLVLNREQGLRDMVREVSAELVSLKWYSTHSVAFALLAMAKFAGAEDIGAASFDYSVGEQSTRTVQMNAPIHTLPLESFPLSGAVVKLNNPTGRTLFASVAVRGTPAAGREVASATGLSLDVAYTDPDGGRIDIGNLGQGQDFVAEVRVSNRTDMKLDNLALSHIVPSGWEIHNTRMDDAEAKTESDVDYEDIRDDRIYRYFSLDRGETKSFSTLLNAAYLGRYYLPAVSVEAMYDASKQARTEGQWVEVSKTRQ